MPETQEIPGRMLCLGPKDWWKKRNLQHLSTRILVRKKTPVGKDETMMESLSSEQGAKRTICRSKNTNMYR